MEITCPSGLRGVIREMTVAEVEMMSNPKTSDPQTLLLKSCWLETTDHGPYPDDKNVDWGNALTADRFYTMLMIRAHSVDTMFAFSTICEDCGKKFEWEFDLADLGTKPVPEESLEKWSTKSPMSADFQGDVGLKLADGPSERAAQAMLRKKKNGLTAGALSRVVSIDGEVSHKAKHAWWKKLTMKQMRAFLQLLDETDGGVETDIEVECPHCDEENSIALPFRDSAFWAPPLK